MTQGRKIGAVIVARQGSTRFPKKAMIEIEGVPVIGHIIQRLKACSYICEITIATSTNVVDDEIEKYGLAQGVKVFRGHPEDVMHRIAAAVELMDVEAFIEIGGDCPLVSPDLLNTGIKHYFNSNADIVSNALIAPFNYPVGYDFILIKKPVYMEANVAAGLSSERFQPFQYIVKNSKKYKVFNFTLNENFNYWRWTLDYKEDYDFIAQIFKYLYAENPYFSFNDIKDLLEKKPLLTEINKMHVEEVNVFSAWSTGSYVKEMHADIVSILEKVLEKENKKKFKELIKDYEQIKVMLNELIQRAKTK